MSHLKEKKRQKRTPAQKHGRLVWIQKLQERNSEAMARIEKKFRMLFRGLQGFLDFPEGYFTEIVARTQLEKTILQILRESSPAGILPSQLAYRLRSYGIDRFQVLRTIKRMNRRLQKEIGEDAAQKVGHKWSLSAFLLDNWSDKDEKD